MESPIAIEVRPGLTLEGRLAGVAGARGGLVLCHPHPLYGGDMDNPVVIRAAEVAREVGLATLRFNFRGVGASGGGHDNGRGEQDDVRSALAALRTRLPAGWPVGLAGYSFGAWVCYQVAEHEPGLSALCLIAPPLAMVSIDRAPPAGLHLLVVAGTRDQYCPVAELERLSGQLPEGSTVTIEGADHFFFGKLFPLGEAIRRWALGWVPA
jgi:alpha/beta superfamily hydrolase